MEPLCAQRRFAGFFSCSAGCLYLGHSADGFPQSTIVASVVETPAWTCLLRRPSPTTLLPGAQGLMVVAMANVGLQSDRPCQAFEYVVGREDSAWAGLINIEKAGKN